MNPKLKPGKSGKNRADWDKSIERANVRLGL